MIIPYIFLLGKLLKIHASLTLPTPGKKLIQLLRKFTSFHQPREPRYAQKPIPNRSTNPLKQSYSATLFQQTFHMV